MHDTKKQLQSIEADIQREVENLFQTMSLNELLAALEVIIESEVLSEGRWSPGCLEMPFRDRFRDRSSASADVTSPYAKPKVFH